MAKRVFPLITNKDEVVPFLLLLLSCVSPFKRELSQILIHTSYQKDSRFLYGIGPLFTRRIDPDEMALLQTLPQSDGVGQRGAGGAGDVGLRGAAL